MRMFKALPIIISLNTALKVHYVYKHILNKNLAFIHFGMFMYEVQKAKSLAVSV